MNETKPEHNLAAEREGKKTVALVGMAHTTRDLAPWDDERVEIWTLNEAPSERFDYIKRVSRHFQLHPKWDYSRGTNQNDPQHWLWLQKEHEFPIYLQAPDEQIPSGIVYPWEEIAQRFNLEPDMDKPDHFRNYTNTFPYMMCLAILEGFERIEIYGFEMGSDTEYAYQRSSAAFWLGYAKSLMDAGKLELYIPEGSELLAWGTKMYAYQQLMSINPMAIEIDRNRFKMEFERCVAELNVLQGRQNEVRVQLENAQRNLPLLLEKTRASDMPKKVKAARLHQMHEEYQNEVLTPLNNKMRDLDNQKIQVNGQANYHLGMRDYAQLLTDRMNNRREKAGQPMDNLKI